ncbi:hypothetical protein BP6252_10031 [Coleophoma cylindrospora]|uniref:DUF6590 domain-containing protein n=1 Tax=Coleophoma cylindrospora TaxID=1849047 RepID=A0A3D8QX81_9HELO|nr:hypothetical protein BP6252_10031 [Coleophoma cylindrospora]
MSFSNRLASLDMDLTQGPRDDEVQPIPEDPHAPPLAPPVSQREIHTASNGEMKPLHRKFYPPGTVFTTYEHWTMTPEDQKQLLEECKEDYGGPRRFLGHTGELISKTIHYTESDNQQHYFWIESHRRRYCVVRTLLSHCIALPILVPRGSRRSNTIDWDKPNFCSIRSPGDDQAPAEGIHASLIMIPSRRGAQLPNTSSVQLNSPFCHNYTRIAQIEGTLEPDSLRRLIDLYNHYSVSPKISLPDLR